MISIWYSGDFLLIWFFKCELICFSYILKKKTNQKVKEKNGFKNFRLWRSLILKFIGFYASSSFIHIIRSSFSLFRCRSFSLSIYISRIVQMMNLVLKYVVCARLSTFKFYMNGKNLLGICRCKESIDKRLETFIDVCLYCVYIGTIHSG